MPGFIKFDVSKTEFEFISLIASRAVAMAAKTGVDYDRQTALMDIEACHCNGNPLRLQELARAEDFDFAHDVFGIRRHLNRETGQLQDYFSPRYSKR